MNMNESLCTTALHSWHIEQGARLVDFAGWEMPVQYNSIVEEHLATRQGAGLFDVSHMGRVRFDGAGAARFLDRLLTRRVLDLQVGQIRYSLITNEEGNVLDDVLVYHLQTPSEIQYHMLVVNASNRLKILDWLTSHQTAEDEVQISDCTLETAMIAVQGPHALQIVDPLVDVDLNTLRYYQGVVTRQMGKPCTVSRTGYTGEDGVELIVHADKANQVVNNLFASGRDLGIRPVGLGARDTLRLEAALPLYGHELDESTSPFQAGLDFAVNLEDAQQNPRQFVGSEALAEQAQQPRHQVRVGLALEGRRAAREGHTVHAGTEQVGVVTSGSFSPTLQYPIAMAYLNVQDSPSIAEPGMELEVDIRGTRQTARVTALPFYRRDKSS